MGFSVGNMTILSGSYFVAIIGFDEVVQIEVERAPAVDYAAQAYLAITNNSSRGKSFSLLGVASEDRELTFSVSC